MVYNIVYHVHAATNNYVQLIIITILCPHVSVIVNVIVGLLVIISTLLCHASLKLWCHRASGPLRLQVIYNNQEILHGGLNMTLYLHVTPSPYILRYTSVNSFA